MNKKLFIKLILKSDYVTVSDDITCLAKIFYRNDFEIGIDRSLIYKSKNIKILLKKLTLD